ncbi:MAG: YdeI/OmpD-associated family protein [Lacunisphaera sp.]
MTQQNQKVDEYIAKSPEFARPILVHLRELLHRTCPKLTEKIKWRIPHFDYAGEMMCIAASYKSHCSFTFWKGSIMKDERLKKNPSLPAAKRYLGKLTAQSDLPPDAELEAFIKEAMVLNEKGIKLPPRKSERPKAVAMPDYFAKSLAAHPKANKIFESKSDSFRKEYLVWITEAKTEATRQKRIEESLAWISEGKSRFWKYQK